MNEDSKDQFANSVFSIRGINVCDLFARASAGTITPVEFCTALDKAGVTGTRKTLYTRDAFSLTLEQAKKIAAQVDHASNPYGED